MTWIVVICICADCRTPKLIIQFTCLFIIEFV